MCIRDRNARVRSITPNGNIAFWGMVDPPETIEIKEGKGTTAFFCQEMRSVLKGTGSDDKVIFCGQNNAIGGISGVENIYLRNNSHDLQVFGASEFFNIYNETDNIKNNPVSYTHLDVYKRQALWWTEAEGCHCKSTCIGSEDLTL